MLLKNLFEKDHHGIVAMELKWLEDFLALARTGNFSRAAQERNVTQSAFSRRIQALEAWLGVALVDRSSYPTTLTPAGEVFRESADETSRSLTQLRDELRRHERGDANTVTFSAQHTLCLWFFPTLLHRLNSYAGPLTTRLMADNLHNCVQLLVEGNCDFLLCFRYPGTPPLLDPTRYPSLTLGEDQLIPVAAPDDDQRPLYRLPGRKAAPIPHLDYSAEVFLGKAVTRMLRQNKAKCHLVKTHENAMAEALKSLVKEGHGLAWLPRSSIRRELRSKRLLRAGDKVWDVPLEVRIYRSTEATHPKVDALWSRLLEEHT